MTNDKVLEWSKLGPFVLESGDYDWGNGAAAIVKDYNNTISDLCDNEIYSNAPFYPTQMSIELCELLAAAPDLARLVVEKDKEIDTLRKENLRKDTEITMLRVESVRLSRTIELASRCINELSNNSGMGAHVASEISFILDELARIPVLNEVDKLREEIERLRCANWKG